MNAASNRLANDENVINGSFHTNQSPLNTGTAPAIAAILLVFLLLLKYFGKAQVLAIIFIPSTECNKTHPTSPP